MLNLSTLFSFFTPAPLLKPASLQYYHRLLSPMLGQAIGKRKTCSSPATLPPPWLATTAKTILISCSINEVKDPQQPSTTECLPWSFQHHPSSHHPNESKNSSNYLISPTILKCTFCLEIALLLSGKNIIDLLAWGYSPSLNRTRLNNIPGSTNTASGPPLMPIYIQDRSIKNYSSTHKKGPKISVMFINSLLASSPSLPFHHLQPLLQEESPPFSS